MDISEHRWVVFDHSARVSKIPANQHLQPENLWNVPSTDNEVDGRKKPRENVLSYQR